MVKSEEDLTHRERLRGALWIATRTIRRFGSKRFEIESVVRPALVLTTGRTLAFVLTFLIPVVLVRVFDPTQFGTYKQLFLVFSTFYGVAPMGMASSLYYFLPSIPQRSGHCVGNALLVLGTIGLAGAGILTLAAPKVAVWLDNPELSTYLPWIGLYAFLTMLSSFLEIVLVAEGQYVYASASYGLSDLLRAAALILSALLFRHIGWLLVGAIAVAFLRALLALVYLWRKYRGSFAPDLALLKLQLAYSFPFGCAVCIEVLQASLPQYAVSHLFAPATFAIFAVGCLENPLMELVGSAAGDVMMVKMQANLAAGQSRVLLKLWHETTAKLALLFFPMIALAIVAAREIIVLVYTDRYLASVPIFVAWSSMALLAPLTVDAMLRVFAQTRSLLALNIVRLVFIAALIKWVLVGYGLVWATLVVVLANVVFKVAALARIKTLLGVTVVELLPWRRLATSLSIAIAAAAVAIGVKHQFSNLPIPFTLAIEAACVAFTYGILVWRLDVLSETEKSVLRQSIGKIQAATAYQPVSLGG